MSVHHQETDDQAKGSAGPRRLSPIDASWLLVESANRPMHVGCLQIFSKPRGARKDFTLNLQQELLRSVKVVPPYCLKLGDNLLHAVLPTWVMDHHPDLDYHLRRVALPSPGGEKELRDLLARLHSRQLDLSRPLWEIYLIDGMEHRRFALFAKMHHSLVDGINGMRLLRSALSTNPHQRHMPAPWSCGLRAGSDPADAGSSDTARLHGIGHMVSLARAQLRSASSSVAALGEIARAALPNSHSGLSAPYTAPVSVFNGEATSLRHFAHLQVSLRKMKDLAHRADVKLNDVFLAMCGGALRRYLRERNALPHASLVAGVPVSVRPKGDAEVGTAITFALSVLGTDLEHPRGRLQRIHQATAAAKQHLQRMDRTALTEYTMLMMAPYIVELVAGFGQLGHPAFNLVVSNVPGPTEPLYFNGARLEEMYPLSVLTHGQTLNITAISCAGYLNIGFIGCKETVPEIELLADYTREALEELVLAYPRRNKRRNVVEDAAA